MSVDGHWEGKLIDATGLAALLTLDLTESGGELKGDFGASFLPEAGDCCDTPKPRQVQTGPVTGTVDEAAGTVRLDCEMTIGLKPIVVALDGRLVDADPHAVQAIAGCFHIREGVETLTLEGGGCVLWQYAQPKRPRRTRKEVK